jgi:hypothetical protein
MVDCRDPDCLARSATVTEDSGRRGVQSSTGCAGANPWIPIPTRSTSFAAVSQGGTESEAEHHRYAIRDLNLFETTTPGE